MNKLHRAQMDKNALRWEHTLKKLRRETKIDRKETSFCGKSLEKSASFSMASQEGAQIREKDYW